MLIVWINPLNRMIVITCFNVKVEVKIEIVFADFLLDFLLVSIGIVASLN